MTSSVLTGGSAAIAARYRAKHPELIEQNPEFAAWLESEYAALAGGWQY
jgi:hypothetical protein